jgi:uncharacterized protein
MKKTSALVVACVAALAVPAIAQAHVTLHPNSVPAGAFTVLDIRVPNEESDANTTKLVVQMPPGFTDVLTQEVPGWTAHVATRKLAKPVKTEDGLATEEVSRIAWSGGSIPPGQFQEFPISVQIPDKPGSALTFKALQTYDNGKVVRWIGSPSSETPAPDVDVTASGGVIQDVTEGGESGPNAAAASETGPTTSSGSSSNDTLAIIALIVGALGLGAGGAALYRARRSG